MHQMLASKWPADGLERVASCPVCGSNERTILHDGLTDRIFFCAPGKWTLHLCGGCGSGYLDPRPSQATIHLAYRSYYTHEVTVRQKTQGLSTIRRLMRMLGNGYRNSRYGTHYAPASRAGNILFKLFPNARLGFDRQMRYLPRLPEGGRLLDLGFGSGAFLELAREGGWVVTGADPDPVVVDTARERGLDVRQGGIEAFADQTERFDVVTLSHVIEHVPNPQDTLRSAYSLLKPGGMMWICTPNLAGPGYQQFERHWRGLEPPRHLVIFNRNALMKCAASLGFTDFIDLPYAPIIRLRFLASIAVEQGTPNVRNLDGLSPDDKTVERLEFNAKQDPNARDDILFTCRKPMPS